MTCQAQHNSHTAPEELWTHVPCPRKVTAQLHSPAARWRVTACWGREGRRGGSCTRGSSSAQVNGAGRSSDAQPQHLLLGVGSGRGRQQQTAPRGKRRTQSCAALPTLAFCGRRGKDSQRRDPEHPSRRGQHPSAPHREESWKEPEFPGEGRDGARRIPCRGLSESTRSVGRSTPSGPGSALGDTALSQRPGPRAAPRT